MAISKQRNRELMELAIEEMLKSQSEHADKADPKVGAVLVSALGEVLGLAHRGELRKGDHAEFTLFERKHLDKNVSGAILYTTLEPCVERNPPKNGCTFRAINARVSKVVIGHLDPDPTVAGKGVELLEKERIAVEYFDKDLEERIASLNSDYFHEKEELAKQLRKKEVAVETTPLEQGVENFALTDLSDEAQQEMISRMNLSYPLGSNAYYTFLNQFGFIKVGRKGTTPRPTGLGLLMLGKSPQLHFPQARLKFTIHRGEDEPIIKDFDGPLVLMPSKVEEYLDLIFSGPINREQFHRVEISDVPKKVLREVIINAIVHRDYTIDGARIMVDVFPDRVEVSSPGAPKFPIEKFYEYSVPSVSRNQKIAYIFNQMRLVEERGLGMRELKSLKDNGTPPRFELDQNIFTTTIYRKKVPKKPAAQKGAEGSEGIHVERIRDFIVEKGRISAGDYTKRFGVSAKTASRQLTKLVEDGVLGKEGEKRGTRYFLTSGPQG